MVPNVMNHSGHREFLGPAIDTLPVNMAILDAEGTVVLTNRAWREFARANGGEDNPEIVGENYLEIADAADDPTATRAADGIRALLRGEREQFELDYPCHAPGRERWFLMWAASFTDGGDRYVTVAHVDITARKARERALERQRDELRQLQRLNTLVREVTQALQDTTTRDTIERAVCEHLTESALYRAVWIGTRGETLTGKQTVIPQAAAGVDESYLDGSSERGPAERALRTDEVQVINDIAAAEMLPDEHRERALARDLSALAAVPLATGEATYGVLVVYASQGDTIGVREQEILADLGQSIALAIQRVHSQRSLAAETVVALDLRLPDSDFVLCAVSAALDCELVLDRRVSRSDGENIYYLTVYGATPTQVCERLTAAPSVTGGSVVREATDGQPALLEIHLEDTLRCPLDVLTDYGGSVVTERAADGDLVLGVELPPEVTVGSVLDALREVTPDVRLVSKQHIDRPAKTVPEIRAQIRDELTPKQEATLKAAYARGYYSWPRESTMEELAGTFDVSAPTLHYRMRRGQRTVMEAIFDEEYGNDNV